MAVLLDACVSATCCIANMATRAKVAELVDAPDLGSGAERRESSSLSFRTSFVFQRPVRRGGIERQNGQRALF